MTSFPLWRLLPEPPRGIDEVPTVLDWLAFSRSFKFQNSNVGLRSVMVAFHFNGNRIFAFYNFVFFCVLSIIDILMGKVNGRFVYV